MDSDTTVTLYVNDVDIFAEAECDIFFFLMVSDSILKKVTEWVSDNFLDLVSQKIGQQQVLNCLECLWLKHYKISALV